jgi:outer membrane protein, heavy metal efflux system
MSPLCILLFVVSVSVQAEESTLSLANYLSQVRTYSPALAVANAEVQAVEARAAGLRIAPPMVGMMTMREAGETNHGIEIAQEIPFPTKIYLEKKARHRERDAAVNRGRLESTLVIADAKLAFISYWRAYERLQLLKDKEKWLNSHVKLSRTTTQSDTRAQVHLMEVESAADMAENDVLSANAELLETRGQLNLFVPGIKGQSLRPAAPPIEDLPSGWSSQSRLVEWKAKELNAKEAQLSQAKQTYLPDLYVRYRDYNGTTMQPASQEVMVGVTLPFLYFWQPRAEVAAARAGQMKAEAELQKARLETDTGITTLNAKAQAIRAQLRNVEAKLLPRASRRMQLLRNISQRTMEGLDQHRAVMLSYLDFRMQALDLRLAYEQLLRQLAPVAEEVRLKK